MATLERAGYDPAVEPIPVSPAAHYSVGGIVTDLDGRSTLPGLYAAGECAATGVHGANRLASNSLLECLVFGRRAALAALAEPSPRVRSRGLSPGHVRKAQAATAEVRRLLWEDAGVIRSAEGLERLRRVDALLPRLVAEAALARRESRGAHFRSDFPSEDDAFRAHVVLTRGEEPRLETWA
jgi:L-aspartate oxidase